LQLLLLLAVLRASAQTIAPTNNTIVDPDADNILLVFNDTRLYHTITLAALLPEADFAVRLDPALGSPRMLPRIDCSSVLSFAPPLTTSRTKTLLKASF
jgi:hypothetical protein